MLRLDNGTELNPKRLAVCLERLHDIGIEREEKQENRVAVIRKKAGLSRAAFSRRYNIPIRTLENWEKDVTTPPGYVVNLLEQVIGKTVNT